MPTVSSLGSGSGLDLEGIVTKLMSVEQQPLTALAQKEAGFQSRLSAFGLLKGALSGVQNIAKTLADKTTYTGTSAAVADTSVVTATTTSSASAASYAISVGQLAQAQVLRTNTNFAATTDTFNSGSLSISVGGATATNITIDSSNNTLGGIRDAINNANAGLTATIINDGTTNRLLLSSITTGLTAGAISVVATDSAAGGSNALTLLNNASLISVQDPLDASLSINGLAITRASNTITDAVSGVTLNLVKAGTLAVPLKTQLTISRNTASIQGTINAFVANYNTAVKQIKSLSAYDSTNKAASLLTGDSTVRNIQSQLANLVGTPISGVDGGISRLSDIGITLQKDGTLSTDSTKLAAALNDPGKNIAALFTSTSAGNEGIAVRFNAVLEGFVGSSGLIADRSDGINRSIKSIEGRRDALSIRLTKIEANYRAQFSALDSTIASLQRTSTFLTQQLSALPKTNSR